MNLSLLSSSRCKTPGLAKPARAGKSARGHPAADLRFGFERPVVGPRAAAPFGQTAPLIQAKLRIGEANDKFEQEADQVADQVMRMPETRPGEKAVAAGVTQPSRLQRTCTGCKGECSCPPTDEERGEVAIQMKPISSLTPESAPRVGTRISEPGRFGKPLVEVQRKVDGPFSPKRGVGVVQSINEEIEEVESAKRLKAKPDEYDPTYVPRIETQFTKESYLFDFSVPGADLPCVDLKTIACDRNEIQASQGLGIALFTRKQFMGKKAIDSVLGVKVVAFPVTSTVFLPREEPNKEDLNHELYHLRDAYETFQSFKSRLSRNIRARVIENRKKAAANPDKQADLLGQTAIEKLAIEEAEPFVKSFDSHLKDLGDSVHALGEGVLSKTPPDMWNGFKTPPLKRDTTGSFVQPIKQQKVIQPQTIPGQTPEAITNMPEGLDAVPGGGQPLPESVRGFFEPRLGYDFSQVRVHSGARAAESARAINASAYTSGRDIVFGAGYYAPQTNDGKRLLAHELAHVIQQGSDSGPAGTPRQREAGQRIQRKDEKDCPTLVSFTARGRDPSLSDKCKGDCRFELGCCTTKRGECGSSGTSGMVLKAVVRANEKCKGELAFMQNLLSTKRKTTLSDGTVECKETDKPHKDGAIPWKGCKVSVSGPGEFTITSDDCPNRELTDNPSSVSITDSFKTFLLWKPDQAKDRRPIANVAWGWSGAITKAKGETCDSKYKILSAAHTDGDGKTSDEAPVITPEVKDLKAGKCK